MKIIGFTYIDGRAEMVLRGDSCMLNGSKPFFLPDGTKDVRATRCMILRVSRLGKNIQAKFAGRYYDAWAAGLDIIAWDILKKAQKEERSWTEAIAFDYALPIGEWLNKLDTEKQEAYCQLQEKLCLMPAEAIESISKLMTIRQGDIIYIDYKEAAQPICREQIIEGPQGWEDKLYCKIK